MMDAKEVDEMETQDKETIQIQKIVSYGLMPNLDLTVMKAALAFLSGSLAVTASTIDSLTYFVAYPVLYVELKLSSQKTSAVPLCLYKKEFYVGFWEAPAGSRRNRCDSGLSTVPPKV